MYYLTIDDFTIKFNFNTTDPGFSIRNSYKATTKSEIKQTLQKLWLTKDYFELCARFGFSRDEGTQVDEWAAHNVLYRLGIKRARTGHTDVNNSESKLRQFCYKVLALLHG